MEITGVYKKSVTEFYDCTITIENGITHRVIVPRAKPIEYFSINPKNNAAFEYYKLPTKKGLGQINSNYKIEYKNESENTNTVYVKLSVRKLYGLKWQKKEFVIQDRKLKVGVLQYLIITLIGFIGFLIGYFYDEIIASKKENNIENHTADINKAAKISNTESENKIDSTNLKSSGSLKPNTE